MLSVLLSRASRYVFARQGSARTIRYSAYRFALQENPEVYVGYDPDRTLEDVDCYSSVSPREPPIPTSEQLFSHKELDFDKTYLTKSPSIHTIKEGGYVLLSDDEIHRYMPEGLMGESNSEFEYTDIKAWMIRDSTKMLCRLIEEHEKGKDHFIAPRQEGDAEKCGVALSDHLSGLTDRPERSDALLQVYRRGALISGKSRPSRGNYNIMCGEGSLVEDVMDHLRKGDKWNEPDLPSKILVTGEWVSR